jgi:type I restriction enzyme S subunit
VSWPLVKLGDVVESIMGQAPLGKECNKKGNGTVFVKAGEFGKEFPVIKEWTTKPLRYAKRGDTLLCVVGATCGKVNKAIDCAIGRSVAAIRPIENKIDESYLFYFISSWSIKLRNMSQGAAQTVINKEMIANLEIPLPPLEEQKRIAAILDKADSIRRKRQQAINLADDFLRSVFLDMFGDPKTNPKAWDVKTLGDVITKGPTNGIYKPATDYGSGNRILRIDGFYDGVVGLQSKLKRVRISEDEIKKFGLPDRSIVINRVNSIEYLGKCAFIQNIEEKTVFESNMMNFTVDELRLNPRFLVQQLQMSYIKMQIKTCSKDAVNQSSINQTDVKSFEIILPNIELQNEYENICVSYLKSKINLEKSLDVKTDLFNSLSQKAFAGEL